MAYKIVNNLAHKPGNVRRIYKTVCVMQRQRAAYKPVYKPHREIERDTDRQTDRQRTHR